MSEVLHCMFALSSQVCYMSGYLLSEVSSRSPPPPSDDCSSPTRSIPRFGLTSNGPRPGVEVMLTQVILEEAKLPYPDGETNLRHSPLRSFKRLRRLSRTICETLKLRS